MFLIPVASKKREVRWNGGISMKSLTLKLQRFLVSEDGPTAVEYAVMLALIVIVCLTAISALGTKASATFDKVSSSIGTTN
jgi:pilus assembly protein Flp/PilA